MNASIREWLDKQIFEGGFFRSYPYYAFVLAKLNLIEDPDVPVMAISERNGGFFLHVNREFFRYRSKFLSGVLLHEIHHIVLGHVTTPRYREVIWPDLMELAMEVSANEYIKEPLPGKPVTWETYAALGLRPGQSTWQRYELLARARRNGTLPPSDDRIFIDSHAHLCVGPADTSTLTADSVRLKALLASAFAEAGRSLGENSLAKIAGTEPDTILQSLAAPSHLPHFNLNWAGLLRNLLRQRRTTTYTFTRPNRRFPERLGDVPGRTRRVNRQRPALLVAIDTSSSMSTDDLTRFSQELKCLNRFAALTIVECDAAIQRVQRFSGTLMNIQGRGGTDLRPVFEPAFLREHRPDGVLYFTDGAGPYPIDEPLIPTLWLLVGDTTDFSCPWGQKFFIGQDRRILDGRHSR